MTPTERDSARRARILDAGLEVFGTTGYATSRIVDVCRLAHVTARNFYDHFESREALLLAVYDRVVSEVHDAMVAALRPELDDPIAEIRAGLGAFVRTLGADERRLRVNFIEVVGASPGVEAHRRRAVGRFRQLLIRRVQRRIARGLVVPARVELTASALVGAIQESLVDWMNQGRRPPLEEVLDELVRIYALALLGPPLPGRTPASSTRSRRSRSPSR